MDTNHYTAVMAGAGTGKTYSLVENYLSALFNLDDSKIKKRPSEILALTFTQKAANEMRIRIANRLSGLLYDSSVSGIDKEEIKKILRFIPNATISTFHGFCAQVLRSESLAIGIDDRFLLLTPKQERELAQNILRPIIIRKIKEENSTLKNMIARFRLGSNEMSLGLIDAILSTYFKLWEKGLTCSGLKDKITNINEKKYEIDKILDELDRHLKYFISLNNTDSTSNRLTNIGHCLSLLINEIEQGDEYGIASMFSRLKKYAGGNYGDKVARQSLATTIKDLGSSLVEAFTHQDVSEILSILNEFDQHFSEIKSQINSYSYSDLLLLVRNALITNNSLRTKLKSRFSHIMVDEYQDTSPLQEEIIALLAQNKDSKVLADEDILLNANFKNSSSLFVVGDKKQSIYGFRGADVSLFDRMIKKMDEYENFSLNSLTINRRSKSQIINFINLISKHSLIDQGYEEAYALKALTNDEGGRCALWVDDNVDETNRSKANINCTVNGIFDLVTSRSDLRLDQIVVLVRRIRSASMIKEQLSSLGIDARIVGGEGFYQQQEIVDILSALRLITNPKDSLALMVVLRSWLVLLKDDELLKIKTHVPDLDLYGLKEKLADLDICEASRKRLADFIELIDHIKPNVAVKGLLYALNYISEHSKFSYTMGLFKQAKQKWSNIEKLKVLFTNIDGDPYGAIDDFYERIATDQKEPQGDFLVDNNAISIMTIHQSKGLEFDVVVLADSEGLLPNSYPDIVVDKNFGLAVRPKGRAVKACLSLDANKKTIYQKITHELKINEQQEMARLLYVALTRAKKELYIASSYLGANDTKDKKTLLSILLKAQKIEQTLFNTLCPTKIISSANIKSLAEKKSKKTVKWQQYVNRSQKTRLFASAADLNSSSAMSSIITPKTRNAGFMIDGALAHKLIAYSGELLGSFLVFNSHDAKRLVEASLNGLGINKEDKEQTIKAVKRSLNMLAPLLLSPGRMIYEMPLICEPRDNLVIEGFSDLVFFSEDFIGVMEFKSSIKAANSPNTYFQLLSYAYALSKTNDLPIKFLVHVIGSDEKLCWQNFDYKAEREFLQAVKLL